MLTDLEIAIIKYLFNREGEKFDAHNTVFKSRCFTGGGRYLHLKFNDSINFVSDSIKIDMIEMGFYLFCTLFCQDQDNQYLQVTANSITAEMDDYFSENMFCLIKGKDVDVESINLAS